VIGKLGCTFEGCIEDPAKQFIAYLTREQLQAIGDYLFNSFQIQLNATINTAAKPVDLHQKPP
jgi:hypothetical protein